MNFIRKNWKGILVCLVMAVPCWLLGQKFPIVGGPVFGILAGMIVTLLWHDKSAAQPGISFVSKKVLQYAVILLGFGMNLSVIWQTGKQSLPIIVVTPEYESVYDDEVAPIGVHRHMKPRMYEVPFTSGMLVVSYTDGIAHAGQRRAAQDLG